MSETVTIPKEEYEELLNDSHILSCLQNTGVDNWCGWDDAMELYHKEEQNG
jgi:hypothetical protein